MKSFKEKKSSGIDNIPGELVQAEGDTVISALHKISKNMADRRVAHTIERFKIQILYI